MAIEKRQPGEAKAAAAAGTAIGQGQKAVRQEAQAEQNRQQQRAMQWELEKMQMRSQQDFEQELRTRQFDYDKVNRAKEWDIEKLSIASQMDFERDERERQRELDLVTNQITQTQGKIDDGTIDKPDGVNSTTLLMHNLTNKKQALDMGSKFNYVDKLPDTAAEQRAIEKHEMSQKASDRAEEDYNARKATPEEKERERFETLFGRETANSYSLPEMKEMEAEMNAEMEETGLAAENYEVGQVVSVPGEDDRIVVGFDDDGEPLVEFVGDPKRVDRPGLNPKSELKRERKYNPGLLDRTAKNITGFPGKVKDALLYKPFEGRRGGKANFKFGKRTK